MPRNIASQPTVYNGIQFRSKLEAKTAQALDIFGMPWQYEPQGYKLTNGLWYKPDFWLPQAHQFVECKGEMKEIDSAKIVGLVSDTLRPVIVLSYENAMLCIGGYDTPTGVATFFGDDCIYIGKCMKCGNSFFYTEWGSYRCTCCGYHDGDHTLMQVSEVKSATQLFNYAQEIAAHNPLYREISNKFNKEA